VEEELLKCTFGILASRFQIFLTTINLSPTKVITITLEACTLQNLLTGKRKYLYTEQEIYIVEEDIINIWKCNPMRKVSKCKLQKDKEVHNMIVMVKKYERHSGHFTVEQEKLHGRRNMFLFTVAFLKDTYSFVNVLIWCF
jgi:hypothetical protein